MVTLTPITVTAGTGPGCVNGMGLPSGASTQGVLITNSDPTQAMPTLSSFIMMNAKAPANPKAAVGPALFFVSGYLNNDNQFVQGGASYIPAFNGILNSIPPPSSLPSPTGPNDPANYGWFIYGASVQRDVTTAFPTTSVPMITHDMHGPMMGKFYTLTFVNDHTNPSVVATVVGICP